METKKSETQPVSLKFQRLNLNNEEVIRLELFEEKKTGQNDDYRHYFS
jgi:hypothetical protein